MIKLVKYLFILTIPMLPIVLKAQQSVTEKADKVSENKVMNSYPLFPNGGLPTFFKFLAENITYPPASKKAKIEGTVKATFVVEVDGTIGDVKIDSAPAQDLGEEAKRVLLLSPKWIPAKKDGKLVAVSYSLPISFALGTKPVAKQ